MPLQVKRCDETRFICGNEEFWQLSREEKWGYLQEDRAFIDSIVNGSGPLVTALDGLMSVKLVADCYESVRNRKPVTTE